MDVFSIGPPRGYISSTESEREREREREKEERRESEWGESSAVKEEGFG
jgi:hypothetical protein